MQKFEGILFTTDLDGTLLRNDKSISEKNLEAIEYFKSEGGLFTFVTGRIPVGSVHIFDAVKPNAPCGCANGGSIYDFHKKEFLWSATLPSSVLELVECVDKTIPSIGIEVTTRDKIYFCKKNLATEKHHKDEKLPDLICNYRDFNEPIAKILFADECEENIVNLIDLLKSHPKYNEFSFVRSDHQYYEILPKGASKGNLVLKIADILGIDLKKTIAAGDNDNDASMLKNAHIGFAVANASESAKKCADFITVSNEENAIAKIINDLDTGKIII